MKHTARQLAGCVLATSALFCGCAEHGGIMDTEGLPAHLADRGEGTPTSMFGTYCRKGELLVYPFFEYYKYDDEEYNPAELGYAPDQDFSAKFRESEWLLFLGYGLTDDVAIEFEAAVYTEATQYKSSDDPGTMPGRLSESGLGDVQTQINWRWCRETADRPELGSYFELCFPFQEDKVLIGTSEWELKLGVGATKGFPWGTLTARLSVAYEEEEAGLGECAVEYLKKLSPGWRAYLGVEGQGDEFELITEFQWHLSRRSFIKLNNAFGLTPAAGDWLPEIGVMLSF